MSPRNVPDSILARMPKNGGVVMVTFVGSFLTDRGMSEWNQRERESLAGISDTTAQRVAREAFEQQHPQPRATVADVADHIEHVRKVAGIDHVGLGADYDGTTELPDGMDDVSTYPRAVRRADPPRMERCRPAQARGREHPQGAPGG